VNVRVDRGITLLAPWWAMILHAGKDVENRGPGTAARLKGFRGLIALSASKQVDERDAQVESLAIRDHIKGYGPYWTWTGPTPLPRDFFRQNAGKLVGVAELVDAHSQRACTCERLPTTAWAMDGQDHLVLGKRWAIEPVPFSGARGVWYAGICSLCGVAQGREEPRGVCRRCKATSGSWLPLEAPTDSRSA
jgi:hypothetical protein